MISKKKNMEEITFLIKVMNGGGAERVISILSHAMVERGYKVSLILTHQKMQNAVLRDVDKRIKVLSLEDQIENVPEKMFGAKYYMFYARILGKFSRTFQKKESEDALVRKYCARNYQKIAWLRNYFKTHKQSKVVAFLYDSIFLTLLSVCKENKVIISERGDPQQSMSSKTTMAFLHRMFPKADHIVFQSPDVQMWYSDNMQVQGTVIFNPVKSNLPKPFTGERQNKVVNFCRISDQKNLELLIRAFAEFYKDYPKYELYIYGDAVGNGAEGYIDYIKRIVKEKGLSSVVYMLPGCADIHEKIRDYAMFVSSSDYEGMSNSMLEAMAIGLPTICTDCPAGGARAIIRDHENGILVPVQDVQSMYLAMKELVENPKLAERLSENGSKIREDLAVDKIIEKWMEIIND